MTIWALHGFLGLASDFEIIKSLCLQAKPQLQWESVDYLHLRELSSSNTLEEWGENFGRFIRAKGKSSDENVLLGYSQGGRLALHAMERHPDLWSKTILMSTQPGILDWEKPSRLKSDQDWAQRFLNENFNKVSKAWNSLPVFQGSQSEPQRLEAHYNRRQLADCLLNWSVAKQANMRYFLQNWSHPVLYLAGEHDSKYVKIGEELKNANSKIEFEIIPNSGHRVFLDQPQIVSERILQFL